MAKDIKDVLDEIDAAVFSGDEFLNPENLLALKKYVGRWTRAIPGFEASITDIAAEDKKVFDIDAFTIDLQSAKEVKVDTYIANFFTTECDSDFDSDDTDQLIFTFGIENGDLIFSESDITSIAKICDRQWSLVVDVDGRNTPVIFTFLL